MTFYVDDVEESWDYSAKFDFIFARFLTGSIRDWPKFFKQSYELAITPWVRSSANHFRLGTLKLVA